MPPKTLLDTDILSMMLRGTPAVLVRATEYLSHRSEFTFSIVTKYEIYRGMKARRASAQLARFETFCRQCEILPFSDEVAEIASDIYANLYQRGELIGDADILIASTAIANDLTMSTNNIRHFGRIEGLLLDNWNQDSSE